MFSDRKEEGEDEEPDEQDGGERLKTQEESDCTSQGFQLLLS